MKLEYSADARTLDMLGDAALDGAKRSLHYLTNVNSTIGTLRLQQKLYFGLAKCMRESEAGIKSSERAMPLDPEGEAQRKLSSASKAVKAVHDSLTDRRAAARDDLQGGEDDGLADEFTRTMEPIAKLHSAIDDLRRAVDEHDAAHRKARTS
jgi:hypothetical protein